jgi:hypothetical protein
MVGCEDLPEPDHYFLDGYPQLIFRTSAGNPVPTEFFIARMSENSSQYYQVLDTALQLTYRKDGRPYSGYIRTYHRGRYNIEGTFRNGSIERLRFWHPNRILGMDLMVSSNVGQVWNLDGARSISWNGKERILFNPLTQRAREIHDDTLSTFFNFRGEVSYYTLRADSMSYSYYTDGSPRFFLPNGLSGNGEVRRWYPNGQLRAQGQYRNWRQVGTWIEYDTTGVEINREEFGE